MDERFADGKSTREISRDARSELYFSLLQNPEQGPWHHTFVMGIKYVDFGVDRVAGRRGVYYQ